MYLWSIDIDAVLTGMSCFHLLCEEADIRCGSDEMAVTQILPNYNVYADIAQASTVLTTGRHRKEVPSNGSLFVFGSLGCAYVMLYRHFTLLKWKQTWSACLCITLCIAVCQQGRWDIFFWFLQWFQGFDPLVYFGFFRKSCSTEANHGTVEENWPAHIRKLSGEIFL